MQTLPSKSPKPESSSDARQSKGSATLECKEAAGGEDHGKKLLERDDHPVHNEEAVGYVELTLISAQGLKDVKMFGSMSLYAVLWIDPSCKHCTCVSENTGSSPVWDYYLRLPVYTRNIVSSANANADNEDDEEGNCQRLTIQIFSQGAVSDVLVGTAHIPLQDITLTAADKLQYLACQLVRPSGRIQGLVNLSLQYASSSTSHSLHHEPSSKSHPMQGANRNSWFFLSEDMKEEESEASAAAQICLSAQGSVPIAAPDYLDFKGDGEGAGGGGGAGVGGTGASRSSSSANESLTTSMPHSPISSHTEFFSTHNQHHGTSKSMFDNTFDALALADAALDVTQQGTVSMLRPEAGSVSASIGDALLGLVMSQPLQGNSPCHHPSSSSS